MKQRLALSIAVAVLVSVCLVLQGCQAAYAAAGAAAAGGAAYAAKKLLTPEIALILNAAGYEAALIGLKKFDPVKARVIAADTKMATEDVLAYLKTGSLPTADIINQIISGKIGGIDPLLLAEIDAVAGILGAYVPNANVFLTPNEITYLVAFVQGIHDGSVAYLANSNVTVKLKYTLATYHNSKSDRKTVSEFPRWFKVKFEDQPK